MLKMNLDNGEGEFIATKEFKELNNLLKLDILQSWIYDLTEEYNKAFDGWEKEMEEIRKTD